MSEMKPYERYSVFTINNSCAELTEKFGTGQCMVIGPLIFVLFGQTSQDRELDTPKRRRTECNRQSARAIEFHWYPKLDASRYGLMLKKKNGRYLTLLTLSSAEFYRIRESAPEAFY